MKDLEINEGAAVPDDLGDVYVMTIHTQIQQSSVLLNIVCMYACMYVCDHRRKQTLHFLVVGVLRVEGLPGFDRLISSLKHGLYAFAKVLPPHTYIHTYIHTCSHVLTNANCMHVCMYIARVCRM